MVHRIPGRRGDQWSTLYRTRRRCGIHRSMVSCRLVSGAAGTSCTPLYRTRGERRISSSLRYVGFAGGAAGTTCTPLYRTRERVRGIRISNGSQNFGTAGRKRCSIIWNKSRTLSSARTNYCPFGLPMFSLINSSYVRGSKAIRYRPSSNHKRCQLAIRRVFFVGSAGSFRETKAFGFRGKYGCKAET